MTANENIRAQMAALLEQGSLPKSACSGALLKFLKPLLDSDMVAEERSGAGRCLKVRDVTALRTFFKSRFPDTATSDETSARIAGVARFRDSKALAGDTPDIVLLRAWSDTALWRNGLPVPTARSTQDNGLFAFVLTPDSRYELRASTALVENPAMLLAFERLGLVSTLPIALYAGGRVSGRALKWLAGLNHLDFRLIHFPDYDPVGLSEFVRVRAALGDRATLHLPPGLRDAFSRFANPDLLRREASQALLPALRINPLPEVRAVLDLIEHHNAGLEQEALMIDC
ncbi:MAG: hypothetical protein HC841_00955 [Verrucomicrobiae bacterium]|nr:hypothetical protein [Verrucomicrobiae bacterium]